MSRLIVFCLFALAFAPVAHASDQAGLGAKLYAKHCRECHGPTARESEVGDIGGLSLGTVTSAVRAGPGMMPTFALTSEEIAAITAYLARLSRS
ncbi:hypothetical protein GCM10011316_30230 [Roseibium aquae]|uniref:Cytochrome c domain-containing protein n=1 Tax=Roseibium aquae TaxID=1323746 RepID=A0A916TLT9_9HYPH|nr:cytochrome c [Roseibium aquae]GGB56091.1 hypothetical protein GCM10011316_30230 [Roseibium aquae]